jgi:hypothetical protein
VVVGDAAAAVAEIAGAAGVLVVVAAVEDGNAVVDAEAHALIPERAAMSALA